MRFFSDVIKWILVVIATIISFIILSIVYTDITGFYNPEFPYISRHFTDLPEE